MTAILAVRDGDTVYLACDSRVVCGDYYFDTADKVRKYQIGDKKFYLGMAGHDPSIARIDGILDHPEANFEPGEALPQSSRDVARYVSDVMEDACQKKNKHGVDAILVVGGEKEPEVYLLGTDGSLSGPVDRGSCAVGSGAQAALAALFAISEYPLPPPSPGRVGGMGGRVLSAVNAASVSSTEVGGLCRCSTIGMEDL